MRINDSNFMGVCHGMRHTLWHTPSAAGVCHAVITPLRGVIYNGGIPYPCGRPQIEIFLNGTAYPLEVAA